MQAPRDIILFSGTSHPELAQLLSRRLGTSLAPCTVYTKSNRETVADIGASVRMRDVYILQTGSKDVNNTIMELLIIAYACKTSSARNIVGVIPYLPYSKHSKMRKRGCIVAKLLAKMMCKAGLTHVLTIDLHSKEIQGFFDVPVDNLRASPFLLEYIRKQIPDYRNAVIVAKDPGSAKKATSFAERLHLGIAVIHGTPRDDDTQHDGESSPPPPSSPTQVSPVVAPGLDFLPILTAKEKPPMSVVGDVGGRIAIIVDDIVDDVKSFIAAADLLKARGAYKVYVMVTHGILSQDAPLQLEESEIDEVIVTNTVPHDVQKMQCHKIKTVDISVLLCEAIRRIHFNESMSFLFRDAPAE
ncbi:phosphoribosyl pyrophosphate synthase-associated protein 2-like [Paramacrobiotus metropolitanus]|uniref:phosphoribosyl pyrophosphate synthase-associated protein 2-like n=1 Tax=Paramacrobiotus metropolitanus TaxID=2943436 RepID=UPI002445E560|nr:phosphoribosyl pyrophosphate synthase-associated protein 2-like [Paramacrobiotus metropolitanus]